MKRDWNTVEVLRHARHDWLNKIQLIKGNLSLNRAERVQAIIDEIIIDSQQEAKLSNLNLPQLATLFLVTNWNQHYFILDYEVLSEVRSVKMDDTKMTQWTELFFSKLDASVEPFQENHLSISILPVENQIQFFFDFSGTIMKKEEIERFLKTSSINVLVKELNEREFSFEIQW